MYGNADLLREEATTRAAERIWGTGELPIRKQKRRGIGMGRATVPRVGHHG
jgi:hypothetical protein